jgi:hypothetical protein
LAMFFKNEALFRLPSSMLLRELERLDQWTKGGRTKRNNLNQVHSIIPKQALCSKNRHQVRWDPTVPLQLAQLGMKLEHLVSNDQSHLWLRWWLQTCINWL